MYRYFAITISGNSNLCIAPNLVGQQVQAQPSKTDSEKEIVNIQGISFGTKNGLEELQALLQSSEPTKSPTTRQILIPIPTISTEERIPDEALNRLPVVIAFAEFHRIAEKELSHPSPPGQANFEVEGKNGKLSNGGNIYLQINYQKNPRTATISISGYEIPHYEQVRQIEFVLAQISSVSSAL